MNTIPSIFNENLTHRYTAVGGRGKNAPSGISLVVLNRTNHPDRSIFNDIENTGFEKIISIETEAPHYDIEEMAKQYPFVRFILPEKKLNLGEQINLAAHETDSPLFFVLKSGMKIIAGGTAMRMAEREIGRREESKRICTVPVIINSNYEPLPAITFPVTKKNKLRTIFAEPQNEGDLCLYPFGGIGIYSREQFISMGGYDSCINNSYWQLMDFGFRSFLWGGQIALSLKIKICHDTEIPAEITNIDENYVKFKIKNLAPVYKRNYACLPFYRFFYVYKKSGLDLFNAIKAFNEGKKWVEKNKYRWKLDARGVINLWGEN